MKKNWQEPCIAELTMKATETETYCIGGFPSATASPNEFDSMSGETNCVTPTTKPNRPGHHKPWHPWRPW